MGCGDVRLLRTIGGVDFTRQERATLNKLTVSHYEANSLVERSAGLDGVDDRDAHLSAARNHIAIGDGVSHYEANSLVERSAGLDGVDDRDAHLSAARNHIAIGDWNIHLGDEPCGLGEHLVNPLPPMEEETKK